MTPVQQQLLNDYSAAIEKATAGDPDATIKYASIIKGADNYKKKYLGEMAGADRIGLAARKDAAEAEYRAWIAADPKRAAMYNPAALDALVAEANQSALDSVRMGTLGRAQLLSAARNLYRWSKERQKPDASRESGYQDRDLLPTQQRLTAIERRYVPKVDRALFEQALTEYRKAPADKRDAALEAKIAELGMDRIYADTKLGDTATRLAWLEQDPGRVRSLDRSVHPARRRFLPAATSPAKRRRRTGPASCRRRVRPTCAACWPLRRARAARSIPTPTARSASPTAR